MPKEIADALEADLQPLATSGLITRISKYDTNPANNPQSPQALPARARLARPRERARVPLLAPTEECQSTCRCQLRGRRRDIARARAKIAARETQLQTCSS